MNGLLGKSPEQNKQTRHAASSHTPPDTHTHTHTHITHCRISLFVPIPVPMLLLLLLLALLFPQGETIVTTFTIDDASTWHASIEAKGTGKISKIKVTEPYMEQHETWPNTVGLGTCMEVDDLMNRGYVVVCVGRM